MSRETHVRNCESLGVRFPRATTGKRPGFALIFHHTDAVREYAYGPNTKVGHLEKALVAAKANGWTVANMKTDWKVIFDFEQ